MKSTLGSLAYLLRFPPLYLLCSEAMLAAGISLSTVGAGIFSIWPRVIIGLAVFLLPGCYLFVLAPARDDWDLADVVVYGFAYSMALITILGLITRTLSWSISTVEFVWFAFALFGCGAAMFKTRTWWQFKAHSLSVSRHVYLLLAIVFVMLTMFIHSSILMASNSDDQNLHLGAIQGFLRSEPLGWSEPYYESGNRIAYQYFLDYWVLAQALVVKISGVPALLARYLINPFVLTMSVAAMYVFARNLGHCRKYSLSVVIVGMFALSLIAWRGNLPGNQIFVHAHLDKVLASFALAPVALSSAWLFAETGNRRAYWGFAVTFLACASVHSVVGGYALSVIAVWCLLQYIANRNCRKYLRQIILLAVILFLPSIFMRLNATQPSISAFGSGGWFFGIDPRHAGFMTYLIMVLTAICAVARRDARSRLMLSLVAVVGCAMVPLTAWAFRVLLPESQIWRIVWLIPYGYMTLFVIGTGWTVISARFSLQRSAADRLRIPLLILAVPISAYFLQFHSRADFSKDIGNVTGEVSDLLEVATYIDAHHQDRVWIAASIRDDLRNKAIALHWKVISLSRFSAERMAYYSNLPLEQTRMQRADNFRLYDAAIPVEEKLAIIDRYGIAYLLFDKGYAWMVDALYQTDKKRFELVFSGETLRLVRVHH